MNVSKQVSVIQKMQDKYINLQKSIKQRISRITKPVEQYIESRLEEAFPEADFHFLTSFQCGSLTDEWTPHVYVYTVDDLTYSPDGYWYEDDYYLKKAEIHEPPVSVRKLFILLKALTEEVGVKITLVRKKSCFPEGEVVPVKENAYCNI